MWAVRDRGLRKACGIGREGIAESGMSIVKDAKADRVPCLEK